MVKAARGGVFLDEVTKTRSSTTENLNPKPDTTPSQTQGPAVSEAAPAGSEVPLPEGLAVLGFRV